MCKCAQRGLTAECALAFSSWREPEAPDCSELQFRAKHKELYSFSFNPTLEKEEREQGWMLTNLSEQYKPMGFPNDYWQLNNMNRDSRVCDSYPTKPEPPLHLQEQPAPLQLQCPEPGDQQILQATRKASLGSDFICVIDTQPKHNSMANHPEGKATRMKTIIPTSSSNLSG
ncbi:hypothetical protein QTO34_016820 [Cnephaeus nilssonii]|uniref:Myotubularin phosphatase domain-containing protein n=1 Tax=Cnephaeus nilssonii TaxID=3371016 RepID=A0AA40I2Y3_CNENI|nr:hypothetical protein QTO34_016820 [Eptesicus nilssonii]